MENDPDAPDHAETKLMFAQSITGWIVIALAALIAIGTALSEVQSYQWWIRGWDFPRAQIAFLAALLLIGGWFLSPHTRLLTALLLIPSIIWQIARIFPYTPIAPKEVEWVKDAPERACFTALSFNVLQHNREYGRARAMLEREDPDIVLLLETDGGWKDALEPFLSRYPHRVERPFGNTYGMIFVTRLPLLDHEVRFLTDEETPSLYARMQSREGRDFFYMGLHPRPPVPGQDSHERDAEIAIAARMARDQELPVLTMGDFNDVAWSHTSHLFKRIGGYVDPRIGRGPYSTFPAGLPMMRWPLDHLFMSPDFVVRDLRVLENVGSDHLPLIAHLCLMPKQARKANEPAPQPNVEDMKEAREIIRDGTGK